MNFTYRSLSRFTVGIYLASAIAMQIVVFFELPYNNWMRELILLLDYALVALLIWINREHLADFNIDKHSLMIVFLFGAFFRPIEMGSSLSFLCFFTLSVFAIAGSLFVGLRKSKVQIVTTPRISLWTLAAVFAGIGVMLPSIAIFSVLFEPLPVSPLDVVGGFILYFLDNLAKIAIPEEILFRGFLWGYLRGQGLSDKRIWLIQAVLFSLLHFGLLRTSPLSFWFKVPVFALVAGYFVLKTRSVAPSMVSHACVNSLGDSMNYYVDMLG